MTTKQICAAVALGWAWPAALVWLLSGDPKAGFLLIAAPVVGWLAWRMSGDQMRKHGGRQLWPPVGALAAVVACLLLAGCGSSGGANGPTIDDYRPGAHPAPAIVQAQSSGSAALPTADATGTPTPLPAQPSGSTTINVTVNSDYNAGLMDVIAGTSLVFGVFAVTILAIWIRNTRRNV